MKKPKGRIVLIISGGVAAYKSLDLVRHLSRQQFAVDCVMTKAATEFIQPLSFAALSGNKVRSGLFEENDEAEMDHIALSRSADLLLVAPATANLIAKMAQGIADDLATTLLLATDTPIMLAPAMNWRMWAGSATKRNVAQLKQDGIHFIEPDMGEMACGEYGVGKLPDIESISRKALALIDETIIASNASFEPKPLSDKKILITAGATREAIDPVRYISNNSSGKQGFAIAEHLAQLGAEVFLVKAKAEIAPPLNTNNITAETAQEMKTACDNILNHHKIDIAICVAAVCDWRVQPTPQKIKKENGKIPQLNFQPSLDILASISAANKSRPNLVIGFAAETENLLKNAKTKMARKQCDWIIANDVSQNVFGTDFNAAVLIGKNKKIHWQRMSKSELAKNLALEIISHFSNKTLSKI